MLEFLTTLLPILTPGLILGLLTLLLQHWKPGRRDAQLETWTRELESFQELTSEARKMKQAFRRIGAASSLVGRNLISKAIARRLIPLSIISHGLFAVLASISFLLLSVTAINAGMDTLSSRASSGYQEDIEATTPVSSESGPSEASRNFILDLQQQVVQESSHVSAKEAAEETPVTFEDDRPKTNTWAKGTGISLIGLGCLYMLFVLAVPAGAWGAVEYRVDMQRKVLDTLRGQAVAPDELPRQNRIRMKLSSLGQKISRKIGRVRKDETIKRRKHKKISQSVPGAEYEFSRIQKILIPWWLQDDFKKFMLDPDGEAFFSTNDSHDQRSSPG